MSRPSVPLAAKLERISHGVDIDLQLLVRIDIEFHTTIYSHSRRVSLGMFSYWCQSISIASSVSRANSVGDLSTFAT